MKEGNIILVDLPQADGNRKLRPALLLKVLPKYNDFLGCGISSQIHQYIQGFDEILDEKNSDFSLTGLYKSSLIRLLFLAVISSEEIPGSIGSIAPSLHKELLGRLAAFLLSS